THKYAIVMNAQNLPEVKWGRSYSSLAHKDRDRQVTFNAYFHGTSKNTTFTFNNTDEVVAQKNGVTVFGAATYLPPYGKVSGFDEKRLKERGNALDWIGTTHPGVVGYSYQGSTCSSSQCPELSYKTQFAFGNSGLAKKKIDGRLDIYADKSRDNSPIYKLKDYPWLGVSFNLGSESTAESRQLKKLASSFSEDVTQQNGANLYKDKNLVYTTDDYQNKNNKTHQDAHHAVAFYLNAKLHLLDKKQIQNIAKVSELNLGTLKMRIEPTEEWNRNKRRQFPPVHWKFEDAGTVSVKLKLPEVKAAR
ncbi:TPA: PilC family type IV pilus tip adhesin, partial [Neisseria meningitidis]